MSAFLEGSNTRQADLDLITRSAEALIQDALTLGVVVTIENQPLLPLAMGHYKQVVSVRPVLVRKAKEES